MRWFWNITITLELVSTAGETKGKQSFQRQCLPVRILPSHHMSLPQEKAPVMCSLGQMFYKVWKTKKGNSFDCNWLTVSLIATLTSCSTSCCFCWCCWINVSRNKIFSHTLNMNSLGIFLQFFPLRVNLSLSLFVKTDSAHTPTCTYITMCTLYMLCIYIR